MDTHRKIVIVGEDNRLITELDISAIPHANAQAPMYLEVRTRCDCGSSHTSQRVKLAPWGLAVTERAASQG